MHVSRIGRCRGETRHRHRHANIHERVREPMHRDLHTSWLSSALGKRRVEDQHPWNGLLCASFQNSRTDVAEPRHPALERKLIPIEASALFAERCCARSEEHTSELQSPDHLVCRLLLEKKKRKRSY